MTSYKNIILRNTLAICLLFSFLFTLSFYIERYFSSKKEYLGNAQQNLNTIMEKLDAASLQVQDLPIIFKANKDFIEYVESEKIPSYLTHAVSVLLRSNISPLSSTKGLIAVTKPDEEVIITYNATMNPDFFYKTYGLPGRDIEKIIHSAKNFSSSTPYIFFSSANHKTYFTVLFVNNVDFKEPYIIFNVCEFEKFLSDMDSYASIIISDIHNTPLYFSENISERDANKILNKKHVFKYNTLASSTKTFQSMGTLKFTIALPKTKYISDINHHLLFTLLSFLILFLLSIFISQRVSDKTYSPVKQLLEQIISLDSDTLENEFEKISSFISILKNRNNALTDIVANNQNELKEKFINDLLHGHLTEEQVSEGIKLYLSDSASLLPIAIIITECNKEIATMVMKDSSNASSLNLVIDSFFRQEFENGNFFYFSVLSPTSYCTVVSCSNIEALKARVRRLLFSIESDLNFNMYSSISDFIYSWNDLPSAFFTTYFAHTTLKSQEISQKVYSRDEINNPILYSYEVDNEIFSHCLRLEREQLEKSLDFLVKENFASREDYIKRQSQMSVLVYALCMRILTSINTDSETVFGKEYNIYLELRSCQTAKDFRKMLGFIFIGIIEYIEGTQEEHKQNYQEDMINYIHENYNLNISLSDLAKHMDMSTAYVSKLFKRLVGCNFKDYISKVRIDESKRLLVDYPKKSIQEISSEVGFYTAVTYSNVFAKLVGVTPSEYRKMHKK